MNVLQIVPELRSGGVERGTVDFANYLVKNGHKSVVISAGGSLVKNMTDNGVIHYQLNVHKKSLFSILREAKTVARILRSEKIDIVHARSRVPAWIALIACRKTGIPIVTTCHGIYSVHGLSRVMGWGKLVIAISHAVSRHMKDKFGVAYDRIRLIHRGVNLSEFNAAVEARENTNRDGEFIIGIVGRITAIKGHKVLLRACARVFRVRPDAKLWIIGEAPKKRYTDELTLLAQRLGISDKVEFMGTRHDMPKLLGRMNLLVAPAVGEEAFGRVLIEAGACGVPVIASRIGGIVDVVNHGEDGILTPAGDAAALAESIIGLAKSPDVAERLAQAMQLKVRRQFTDTRMFEKTLEVYNEAVNVKRILIIKFGALGDLILSTPIFSALRRKYPNAHIALVTHRSNLGLLKGNDDLDDIYCINPLKGAGRFQLAHLSAHLRKQRFDISIDLQNNRMSHLLSWLSGAMLRLGYKSGKWDCFLNRAIDDNADEAVDPIRHQLRPLAQIGINEAERSPVIHTDDKDREYVDAFLKNNWLGGQRLIGINPGSSPQWTTKQWPAEKYAELCDSLAAKNVRVVITGAKSDSIRAKQIAAKTKTKPIIATGETSIGQLAELIKRCRVFVTSDSAPMHVASAVGTPFVALFGPTDPARHVSADVGMHTVLEHQSKFACSPCYRKSCPYQLKCLTAISVQETLGAVLKHLETEPLNTEVGLRS